MNSLGDIRRQSEGNSSKYLHKKPGLNFKIR